jgi:N-acetylglutamate synthase-like GNAT family acetyltransferase
LAEDRKIRLLKTDEERTLLDLLLWEVLWEPLGLPRTARGSFSLESPVVEIIAVESEGRVVGGLAANVLSEREIEIRHIAVRSHRQGSRVGTLLIEELKGMFRARRPLRFKTFARNTSLGFFEKLGFQPVGEPLEHEDFARHCISFIKMHLDLPESEP